ncbi:ABC transporter permease [Acidithiobacillus caldus]|uniref:FtsX-like permease family protein n=1 Tax=Acidithiobacillus caldus TaxID=33059 RepID=UPI001C07A209|nr:ABC transporter permease [Acidithiobacillus caldus]MBU2801715.1 ABC transporter permease [Acidithiobacillus caldus]
MSLHIPWRAAVWRPLRQRPGATALAILGVALGVALGLAVALINLQAVQDFAGGLRRLAGEADLVLQAPGKGFSEDWYRRLATAQGVQVAAPQLRVYGEIRVDGAWQSFPVWGIAPFASIRLGQPLVPTQLAHPEALFDPHSIVLSPAAAKQFHLRVGETMTLRAAGVTRSFRVIGLLPVDPPQGAVGVVDIASAQWLWGRIGWLNRVDLRLAPGVDPAGFQRQWQDRLPPGSSLETPQQQGTVAARASRAYRANLLVLSLVALFTGAFLIYATLALGVVRQRRSLAVLRVLGLRRREILASVLAQGLALGLPGIVLGIPLGNLAAATALARLGGDLGAGYFSASHQALRGHPLLWLAFAGAGIAAALLGAGLPAWQASRTTVVRALGQGSEEDEAGQKLLPGLILLILAALSAAIPPLGGIPYGAYLAIAILLFATLFLIGPLARLLGRILPVPEGALGRLAFLQMRGTPGRVAHSLSAIVVAFSLVVAMAIMVGSFRDSVADWLVDILRADLYLQAGSGPGARISGERVAAICSDSVVRQCSPMRRLQVNLLPGHPPVELLARGLDTADPGRELQILRAIPAAQVGPPPAWISEILAGISHWRLGEIVHIPVDGRAHAVRIVGIYRDYAYQQGAISIPIEVYRRWTGDDSANGLALWLRPGISVVNAQAQLIQRFPELRQWQLETPRAIRAESLRIFDRSFAATYALEAVAIVIGLLGVANGFGAQILLRQREFALFRTIGLRRRDVVGLLLRESLLLSSFGVALGGALGFAISLLLIDLVNPQSFHWHMGFHPPWSNLLLVAAALMLASVVTMLLSARKALSSALTVVRDE